MGNEPKFTILNVDDDDGSRQLVNRILRHAGYRVVEAATGTEALRLAKDNPDLVLLDVNLPDMSGFEVCRRIKAAPVTSLIPVLHLSATYVDDLSRVEGLEGGADGYLRQPIEPPVLLAYIKALLRMRQADKALGVSHHLLEIMNRHTEMRPLLAECVAEVEDFIKCAAVGIRILDDKGNIPYQAYTGFSQRFYKSESPLSIKSDQCMCVNVIKGVTHPELAYYTEGGSFYMNGTTRFLATVSEEEKGRTRNVCNEVGYESVALVPIRVEDRILGLIHVADPQEGMVPLKTVEVLEGAAMQLGAAIQRVCAEEALRQARDQLEIRVEERTAELWRVNEELRVEIAERTRAEEALYQRADDLAALYEASQVFLGNLDTETIIESLCRLAVDRFGLKMVWVGLVVEGSFDVRPAFAYGFEEGYLESIRVTWDDSPTGRGPTGTAIRTGQATAMNHIERDRTYAPWREAAKARGYRSSAALPLCRGEQVLGALNVYSAEPAHFTAERLQVLQSFANQAAVAIQNAGLFEQVRAGRERLQTLSRQLIEVQEAERHHIACELHDEVGQALTGLKLLLGMSTRLPADQITASLGEAQALANDLMARVRDLSLDLRPSMLDDLGLLPTLLWHFDRYTAQTHVRVTFKHSGLERRRFAPEVETAAYRIVQEALTNVARHAGVSQVTVRLWAHQATLGVQIEDQGTGFDLEAVLAASATTGLAGMRERAVLLGGQLTVESAPGTGTYVTAELPLGHPVEEGEKKER
jgi:signal transduction histidine kinase/CheY-like chemotaxis protein